MSRQPTTRAGRAERAGTASGARAGQHVEKRRADQWRPGLGFHECTDERHYPCHDLGKAADADHECVIGHGGYSPACWAAVAEAKRLGLYGGGK